MRIRSCLLLMVLLVLSSAFTPADTIISETWMFSGMNIYSPTVIYDGGVYKMWYGGWQSQSDYPNDKIYYRTSTDNVTWSSPITVLTPGMVQPGAGHVNDPSVTKHFNSVSQQWQYTMFYTLCASPCTQQSDNQIWSSTGPDGIHWYNHLMLLTGGTTGVFAPGAIIDISQSSGRFWKVYFATAFSRQILMASVNGNRNVLPTSEIVAYTLPVLPGSPYVGNPEVRFVNGTWQLFFNLFIGNEVDIYKVESTSNTQWPSANYEFLIRNSGPSFCATMTPGVLPLTGSQYDLYYGLTPRQPDGSCQIDQQQSIQRWRFNDNT